MSTFGKIKDLTGQTFGFWYVQSFAGRQRTKTGTKIYWKCICKCGKTKLVLGCSLISGKSKSCSCYKKSGFLKKQHPNTLFTFKCGHIAMLPHKNKRTEEVNWSKKSKGWTCRICKNAKNRAEYNTPLFFKRKSRTYNLSIETYQLLQQLSCACGKEFNSENRPFVDHDHRCCSSVKSCGKCVRGLLCRTCNMVLGLYKEDMNLLPRHLQEYLTSYKIMRRPGALKLGILSAEEAAHLLVLAANLKNDKDGTKYLNYCEELIRNKLSDKAEKERLIYLYQHQAQEINKN